MRPNFKAPTVEGMRAALSHGINAPSDHLSIRSVILIEAELSEEEKLGELWMRSPLPGYGVTEFFKRSGPCINPVNEPVLNCIFQRGAKRARGEQGELFAVLKKDPSIPG